MFSQGIGHAVPLPGDHVFTIFIIRCARAG